VKIEYTGYQASGTHPVERQIAAVVAEAALDLVSFEVTIEPWGAERYGVRVQRLDRRGEDATVVEAISLSTGDPQELVAWLARYGRGEGWG
jgi:hypothetical protein